MVEIKRENSFSGRLEAILKNETPRSFAIMCGISYSVMRAYLAGKSEPGLENLKKIAKACRVSVGWLADGEMQPGDALALSPRVGESYAATPKPGKTIGDSEKEGAAEESFSLPEMISMTSSVLKSKTVYRSALASNIRAFHQAVIMEGEMENVRQELREMREKHAADMDELKTMIASLGGTSEKKSLAS